MTTEEQARMTAQFNAEIQPFWLDDDIGKPSVWLLEDGYYDRDINHAYSTRTLAEQALRRAKTASPHGSFRIIEVRLDDQLEVVPDVATSAPPKGAT